MDPRTVEEVFTDFKGRRTAIIKALTIDVQDFFHQCDPDKENLCLYGFPSEHWEVNLPAEEVPPELPEPALGVNFARDGMQQKDWLTLVAVHSDAWLLSVAFYFGSRFGFDKADRKRLFTMINDLPTISEVVTGLAKKQEKEKSSVSNHSSNKPKSNFKVSTQNSESSSSSTTSDIVRTVTRSLSVEIVDHHDPTDPPAQELDDIDTAPTSLLAQGDASVNPLESAPTSPANPNISPANPNTSAQRIDPQSFSSPPTVFYVPESVCEMDIMFRSPQAAENQKILDDQPTSEAENQRIPDDQPTAEAENQSNQPGEAENRDLSAEINQEREQADEIQETEDEIPANEVQDLGHQDSVTNAVDQDNQGPAVTTNSTDEELDLDQMLDLLSEAGNTNQSSESSSTLPSSTIHTLSDIRQLLKYTFDELLIDNKIQSTLNTYVQTLRPYSSLLPHADLSLLNSTTNLLDDLKLKQDRISSSMKAFEAEDAKRLELFQSIKSTKILKEEEKTKSLELAKEKAEVDQQIFNLEQALDEARQKRTKLEEVESSHSQSVKATESKSRQLAKDAKAIIHSVNNLKPQYLSAKQDKENLAREWNRLKFF